MDEAQPIRMKGLAGHVAQKFVSQLSLGGAMQRKPRPVAAIRCIPYERVADMGQVHPNLVSTASFQPALYEGR
jgi:hypothetical protein